MCAQPTDYSPTGSSVQRTFLARILKWVAISSSRGSSQPRDQICIFCNACGFFATEPMVSQKTLTNIDWMNG